jgi:Helix-turn-helix.
MVRRSVGTQIVTLRDDAHVSQRRLAREAEVDQGHLSRIERGLAEPSLAVLESLAGVLGATVSVRLFPTTGPRIRDHVQARIVESLIQALHPSWKRLVEVSVHRPVRGTIDLVLARAASPVIATEVQSDLRRLEQQLRWAAAKAEALPSAAAWSLIQASATADPPSRLLVLRSTHTMRVLARSYEETLRVAYPARSADAVRALMEPDLPWPGAAIIWADVTGDRARLLPGPPRGVGLGA